MTTIDDGAFLADDTMVASYELQRRLDAPRARPHRQARVPRQLGHRGGGPPASPQDALVAVLSVAPAKSKAGTSWLGSPPVRLRRAALDGRREPHLPPATAPARGARPLGALPHRPGVRHLRDRARRALHARPAHPGVGRCSRRCSSAASCCSSPAAVAARGQTVAKWVFVGRIRAGRASAVVELRVAHRGVGHVRGDGRGAVVRAARPPARPRSPLWLRTLGARIGRGVWCDTYWLPEADLVTPRRRSRRSTAAAWCRRTCSMIES